MDHQPPIRPSKIPPQQESGGELGAHHRLVSVKQEADQRMNGWLPSSMPERYRPDKHATRARRTQIVDKRWNRVNDLYIAALYVAILGAFVTGIVNFLGSSVVDLEGSATRTGFAVIQTESLLAALSLVAVSWIGRFATVLGPVAVSRAQASWWLSLPVSTAPFLRSSLTWRLITATFLGVVAWLFLSWGATEASQNQISANPIGVLSAAFSSGLSVLFVMAASALAQTWDRRRQLRKLWSIVPGLAIAALVVEALISTIGVGPGSWASLWTISPVGLFLLAQQGGFASLAIPSVLAVIAGTVTWQAFARIEKIQHADLVDAGVSSARLSGVLMLLESRNINTMLLGSTDLRSTTLISKRRVRRPRHPVVAWTLAELLVLRRTPVALRATLTGCVVVFLVVFSEPGRSTILLCLAVLFGALVAMRGLTAATDNIADQPGLQRTLPLGHQAAWASHSIAPAVYLLPWGVLVGVVTGWAVHGPENLVAWFFTVLIAVISSVSLAASTVRTSVRPSVDWVSVLLTNEAERIFRRVIMLLIHGVDTALLAVLPLALSLALIDITPWFVLFSLGISFIAWSIAVHVPAQHELQ